MADAFEWGFLGAKGENVNLSCHYYRSLLSAILKRQTHIILVNTFDCQVTKLKLGSRHEHFMFFKNGPFGLRVGTFPVKRDVSNIGCFIRCRIHQKGTVTLKMGKARCSKEVHLKCVKKEGNQKEHFIRINTMSSSCIRIPEATDK
jgi:hypothetical protein